MTHDDTALNEREVDRLREAWRERAWPDRTPLEGCPEPGRVWEFVLRGAAPEEARRIVLHGVGCAACACALSLAQETAAGAGLLEPAGNTGEAEALPVASAGRAGRALTRFAWWRWAAAAAALLALLAVPAWWRLFHLEGTPAYRDRGGTEIRALTGEDAILPRDRFTLRWSPGPPGTRYSVRLARLDLTVVASAHSLETAEWKVPAGALAEVPDGAALIWRVEALAPDGSRLASPAFRVRLP